MEKNTEEIKLPGTKSQTKIIAYLRAPMFMALILVGMSVYAYFVDRLMGTIFGIATACYTVIAVAVYYYSKPRVLEAMVQFASNYTQVQKHLLEDLQVPYGLLDGSGRVLWFNKELQRLTGGQVSGFKNVTSIFPEIQEKVYRFEGQKTEMDMQYEGRNYHVELIKVDMEEAFRASEALDVHAGDECLVAIYLLDVTEIRQLQKENSDMKMVSGLIYIDNFDDAMQSVQDVRRSLLAALIERKINKYFASMDGIVRKLEKDKYFVAIKQKYVSQIQSSKFDLLDEVKSVNIGNEMAITISIGMGICGHDYTKACEYATVALDLALGRGGNQAVIKDGDKIYFYGGKGKQVEKNTRVKARVKAHALRELIESKEKVLVMGHTMGDIDSLGAAIGIYRAAKTIGKRAYIVLNDIGTSIRPMVEEFKANDDYEEDLFVNSAEAKELLDDMSLVVVVDTSRPSRVECPELIERGKSIVVIDHHRQSSDVIENASLSYIETYSSSACEMVAEILQYIYDGLKLKSIEADAMYGGIMIDTNNFMNKAGVRTFEAAAFLRKNGADVTRMRKMFRDNVEEYKAKAEVSTHTEIFDEHFAIAVCDTNSVEYPTILGAQVSNELLNIQGIEATFVLTEYNQKIYVSARSFDEFNVQLVMEKLGGGGHMNMAGAQILDKTMDEAVQLVKDTVRQMVADDEV